MKSRLSLSERLEDDNPVLVARLLDCFDDRSETCVGATEVRVLGVFRGIVDFLLSSQQRWRNEVNFFRGLHLASRFECFAAIQWLRRRQPLAHGNLGLQSGSSSR